MTAFSNIVSRSLVKADWRFRGAYYLYNQIDMALMVVAIHTSETSVYFNKTTRRYVPESFHLLTRRREYLKSHSKRNLLRFK
jgi:hypothetical protein